MLPFKKWIEEEEFVRNFKWRRIRSEWLLQKV